LVEIGLVVSEENKTILFHPPFFLICIIGQDRQKFKVHDGSQAKNRKRGDEIKKKSSPLKLLSQSQPDFAEMILGWFPSKSVSETICSIITKF
jgi:hypothetical protein